MADSLEYQPAVEVDVSKEWPSVGKKFDSNGSTMPGKREFGD